MGDGCLEEENVKHPKYCMLLAQWVLALVSFAALASVNGYQETQPLKFAIGMFVVYWLLLCLLLGFMGVGKCPVYLTPAPLEAFVSFLVNVFLFAAFCATAANTMDNVNAKVAAGFSFFLWVVNLGSTWLTFDAWRNKDDQSPAGGAGI